MRTPLWCASLAALLCGGLLLSLPGRAEDWPLFRSGPSRNGTTAETLPTPWTLSWERSLGAPVVSSPCGIDDRVFVATRSGAVFCLDAATGTPVWSRALGNEMVDGTLAVSRGRLLFGARSGKFYCLDTANGNTLWERELRSLLISPPLITPEGDVVLALGSPRRGFSCLDLVTGAERYTQGLEQATYSGFAYAGSSLVVGTGHGRVRSVDRATGATLWTSVADGDVFISTPAVSGGAVYFAPGGWNYNLYRFDLATGLQSWKVRPLVPDSSKPGDMPSAPPPTLILPDLGQGGLPTLEYLASLDPESRHAMIDDLEMEMGVDLTDLEEALDVEDQAVSKPLGAPKFFGQEVFRTSSPAVEGDDVLIVQREDGSPAAQWGAYLLSTSNGIPRWGYQTLLDSPTAGSVPSPILTPSEAIVAIADSVLVFQRSNGTLLETHLLPAGQNYLASPAAFNGRVFSVTVEGVARGFTANPPPGVPAGPYAPSGGSTIAIPGQGPAGVTVSYGTSVDANHSTASLAYEIRYDDDGEIRDDADGTVSAGVGALTATLGPFEKGTRLYWAVRAVDPLGAASAWSALQEVKVGSGPAPDGAPQILKAKPDPAGGIVNLMWAPPLSGTPSGYRVSWRVGTEGFFPIPVDAGNVLAYSVGGLTNYTLYTFLVTAYDAAGAEGPGAYVTETPKPKVTLNGAVSYNSIEDAINAASNGDVIDLGATTFSELIRLKKGVRLRGIPGQTVINALPHKTGGSTAAVEIVDDPDAPPGAPAGVTEVYGLTILGADVGIATGNAALLIQNCLIVQAGTGIHVQTGGSATILNNTVSDSTGDAVRCDHGGAVIRNNLLTFNAGNGVNLTDSDASLETTYNGFFGNGADKAGDVTLGTGTIWADPLYVSRVATDYHLLSASPAVDAGDPTDPYSYEPDPNGGCVDLGCYGNTIAATSSSSGSGGSPGG
ncbi:MAG: PQQ-binding-like beta-propeller repeat protein, partial [Planctomycetes bacterium]|nr:PQQ-binding-like beta-propeller repeat protein [Planctomycetota bacterium]